MRVPRDFLGVFAVGWALLMGTGAAPPGSVAAESAPLQPTSDQELARLLVKLLLRTRAAIAKQYETDRLPGWDRLYKYALAKNVVLPAAVADQVFQAIPDLTGGRAWVKMVVDNPRAPGGVAPGSQDGRTANEGGLLLRGTHPRESLVPPLPR